MKSETFQTTAPEIIFAGNKVFSSQQLLEHTNTCLARDKKSKGEYNPRMLEYCMRSVANFIRAEGYLRAEVGEPKLEAAGNRLRITVPIVEGPLYRLGEIRIDGATVFSPEQLMEMLPLKTGDVASSDAIGEWLFEHMKKVYADRGYIEYTAEPEPHFRPVSDGASEGIVDLKVYIEEGRRFSVRRIMFVGNVQTRDKVIRDALLIREGEFFSQDSYDESIKNLNHLGLFEEIDSAKDLNMRTIERENGSAQIELIIHLKEKAQLRH
ncbi:MAG: hypothetical protein M3R69_11030 [Acidobacteriota bacterium]|nr:hypothetical protein [Acidobacteriota bacterium]